MPFLRLGLCSRNWLELALPTLIDAAEGARLEGDSLLHLDIRSDNLCFRGDRRLEPRACRQPVDRRSGVGAVSSPRRRTSSVEAGTR